MSAGALAGVVACCCNPNEPPPPGPCLGCSGWTPKVTVPETWYCSFDATAFDICWQTNPCTETVCTIIDESTGEVSCTETVLPGSFGSETFGPFSVSGLQLYGPRQISGFPNGPGLYEMFWDKDTSPQPPGGMPSFTKTLGGIGYHLEQLSQYPYADACVPYDNKVIITATISGISVRCNTADPISQRTMIVFVSITTNQNGYQSPIPTLSQFVFSTPLGIQGLNQATRPCDQSAKLAGAYAGSQQYNANICEPETLSFVGTVYQ